MPGRTRNARRFSFIIDSHINGDASEPDGAGPLSLLYG
jgi:hypothetical protein